ncbi:MAG: hypothetical protein ABEJ57_09015 [Halobacteriaceae archaeon]
MLGRLGLSGGLGVLMLLAGIALVASENLLIGTGIALVLAGLGFVANGVVQSTMRQFGM